MRNIYYFLAALIWGSVVMKVSAQSPTDKEITLLKSVLRLRRTKAISVICSVIFLDTLKIERGLN